MTQQEEYNEKGELAIKKLVSMQRMQIWRTFYD